MSKESKKINILILGGNNKCNIPWVRKMCRIYDKDYTAEGIYFDNWLDDTNLNFEKELVKLKERNKDNLVIVAKSAGALLSLIATTKDILKPKKVVVMGIPIRYAKNNNISINEIFNNAKTKCEVLVIQQKNDPEGKSSELKKLIPDGIEYIEIKGNNHVYANYDRVKTIIDNYLNK